MKKFCRLCQTEQVWYNFNLRVGHIYGRDENGTRFVTSLRKGKSGVIVYLYDETDTKNRDVIRWDRKELPATAPLVQCAMHKDEYRKAIGITEVDVSDRGYGYNPRITSRPAFPYIPTRVSCGGWKHHVYYVTKAGETCESKAATW